MILTDENGDTAAEIDLATGDMVISGSLTQNVTF
jgi:hypothetical protein